MNKMLFIYNPLSGMGQIRHHLFSIVDIFTKGGYEVTVHPTQAKLDAFQTVVSRGSDFDVIVASGGDGTLNEVATGALGYENAAVTVFSGGSGNDYVKLFDDPQAFFDLERLLDAEVETFDLIRCNDDISLNICSVGLDARIGTDVSHYRRIPLLQGFRAYAASTVVNVIRGIAEHYKVEVNGEVIDGNFTMVCVCNGRYYGGGFNPVPHADPADGQLEVLLVNKVSRLQVPGVIGKYKSGRYQELPKLVRHIRTDHVRIICDKETPVNLDGELRMATVVDMSIAKEKLRFFYPKGLNWKAPQK